MDGDDIVELYLHRDESAIGESAKAYGSRLRALALGITQDRQAAEECENDAYMEAWNSIPPHEPKGYLYAFLARITRHIALNRCREQNRLKRGGGLVCQLSEELEQCLPAPDDAACRLDEMALSQAINGFLGRLDEEKRNVFLRRYWYMDSVAAIAGRYEMSQSKVKSMLARSRKQLRAHLEKEGYVL